MIKFIKAVKEKASGKVLALSVAVSCAAAAPAAFAVDAPAIDPVTLARTGFTTVTNSYNGMAGDAWKLLVGVVVGFAVMGLFKKFVSKSH